jgi:hypothetical protein
MDLDELECILANLIYEKKIKGHIAHNSHLIVSKENPFPGANGLTL